MAIDFQNTTPLYVQIKEDIKKKIDAGELNVGDKLASHKKLAEQYEVSIITIKGALSSLIDEGFLYSRVGKGTFVKKETGHDEDRNTIGSVKSIGLVLGDLKDPFFTLIAHHVEETCYKKKYNLLLSNTSNKAEKEEQQIQHLKELGVDGLIIATSSKKPFAPEIISKLHHQDFPYVVISYVSDKKIWHVGTNHELGAYMATEHLIKLGHKKIGYINTQKQNALGDLRLEGFKRALREHGLSYSDSFMMRLTQPVNTKGYKPGYELGDLFYQMKDKPTAFFCYDDASAIGLISRLNELGFAVPDDVAVVGFDDIEQASYFKTPLTTIHQPLEKIGKVATERLVERIEGKKPPKRTIFKPTLVIRESCGAVLKTRKQSDSGI